MYHVKVIDKLKKEGCWARPVVGVFNDKDEQVGSYTKGYDMCPTQTFQHFQKDGQDYAVISGEDYTLATVIALPSCEVVCVEDNPMPGCGFCPVEIYIPWLVGYRLKEDGPFHYESWTQKEVEEEFVEDTNWDIKRPEFALVQGCVWGDDNSWKLEVYDLSDVPNKITRHAPFGYFEMAPGKLEELVTIYSYTEDEYRCQLSGISRHTFKPGDLK